MSSSPGVKSAADERFTTCCVKISENLGHLGSLNCSTVHTNHQVGSRLGSLVLEHLPHVDVVGTGGDHCFQKIKMPQNLLRLKVAWSSDIPGLHHRFDAVSPVSAVDFHTKKSFNDWELQPKSERNPKDFGIAERPSESDFQANQNIKGRGGLRFFFWISRSIIRRKFYLF